MSDRAGSCPQPPNAIYCQVWAKANMITADHKDISHHPVPFKDNIVHPEKSSWSKLSSCSSPSSSSLLGSLVADWGDFQFITWSKDKTLRFRQTHHWQDVLQSAGHGQPPDMALPPGGQGYFKQAMLSRLSRPR
ncbi:hypothetical protein BJV78DRAFT_1157851 [Lactifluus subvellereus]|nr:hypothetical protein BJV78DRAFT_1157851 [Lactifluus subvellereus]